MQLRAGQKVFHTSVTLQTNDKPAGQAEAAVTV